MHTFSFIKTSNLDATYSIFFMQFMTEILIRSLFTCMRQTDGKCCSIFWVNLYQDLHLCYTGACKGTNKNYWSLQRSSLTGGSFNVIFEHIPQVSLSSEKDLNHSAEGEKKPQGTVQSNNFVIYWSSIPTHVHFSSFNWVSLLTPN